jgi:hypothetical protein
MVKYREGYNPEEDTKRRYNRKGGFEDKFGEPAWQVARRENTSLDAIHMRVHLYGSPYQRKKKPTPIEAKTGLTTLEWARRLNMHPLTVERRFAQYGHPDCIDEIVKTKKDRLGCVAFLKKYPKKSKADWTNLTDKQKLKFTKKYNNKIGTGCKNTSRSWELHSQWANQKSWLMEEHPDYLSWRAKFYDGRLVK